MKFSVMTYNMHKGFGRGKKFTLRAMQQALADIGPDIVCLQELQGEHKKHQTTIADWPSESQLDFLAQEHWPHKVYGRNVKSRYGDHGNGVLSKLPILLSENIDITSGVFSSRGLLHVQVELAEKPLHIMCTHFGLLKSERVDQYADLEQRITEHVPRDAPLIVAGDFNDWLQQSEQLLSQKLGLQEAFMTLAGEHAKSFPAIKPTLCVDRIYYRHVHPMGCQVLHQEPWNHLSDHVPLLVDFKLF